MITFSVQQFSGPLDLLLRLIDKEELDITQISLARITDQYIEYIERSTSIHPEEMADFLVIAAKLLYIKSKALFPSLVLEEDSGAEELEHQLRIYKEYLDASKKIDKLLGRKKFMFAREFNRKALQAQFRRFSPPKRLAAGDLLAAMGDIVARAQPAEPIEEGSIPAAVSIEDRIEAIRQAIIDKARVMFSRLLSGAGDKTEAIVSFLAMLELIKQRAVAVEQTEMFGEIEIFRLDE